MNILSFFRFLAQFLSVNFSINFIKCAEVVANAGYKVALVEKDVSVRKPCGGGLPSSSMYKYQFS